jgi:hypothetical protein
MIPSDTLKPLSLKDERYALRLIQEIENSFKLDYDKTNQYILDFKGLHELLRYLEQSGFVYFKNNVVSFETLILTEKGMDRMSNKILITIDVSKILPIIGALVSIGNTIIN